MSLYPSMSLYPKRRLDEWEQPNVGSIQIMNNRRATPLDDLRIQCETLRHQLVEAHRALASLSGAGSGTAQRDGARAIDAQHSEDSIQGVALLSSAGIVLSANRRFGELIGIIPEQLADTGLTQHLPAQLAEALSRLAPGDRQGIAPQPPSSRAAKRRG